VSKLSINCLFTASERALPSFQRSLAGPYCISSNNYYTHTYGIILIQWFDSYNSACLLCIFLAPFLSSIPICLIVQMHPREQISRQTAGDASRDGFHGPLLLQFCKERLEMAFMKLRRIKTKSKGLTRPNNRNAPSSQNRDLQAAK
jgi:hypothetical protein